MLECTGKDVKLLLDTKGPEIRTKLKFADQPVEVKAGEHINITKPFAEIKNPESKKLKTIA